MADMVTPCEAFTAGSAGAWKPSGRAAATVSAIAIAASDLDSQNEMRNAEVVASHAI